MDSTASPIIFMIDDWLFATRLETAARAAGYTSLFVTNERQLAQAMVKVPLLTIVDLLAVGFNWQRWVGQVRGPGKKNNHLPGFFKKPGF